jgi:hypothetical protein
MVGTLSPTWTSMWSPGMETKLYLKMGIGTQPRSRGDDAGKP